MRKKESDLGWRDREEFRKRVREWARKLNVDAHAIYIRPMSRKWASCSTAGTLSFNDELLEMDREVGDYVIVHELLHFSVPNHGKLWKSLMRAHLGEYEHAESLLMKHAGKNALNPSRRRSQTAATVSTARACPGGRAGWLPGRRT